LTAGQLAFGATFRMWGRSFGDSLLLAQASSWLFLRLACLLLPNLLQSDGGFFSLARGKPAIAPHSGSLGGGARRAPALDRNPVYWLVIRNSRMPWAVWFIWAALAVGFAWFFYRQPTAALAVGQNGWLLLLVVLRILVGVYACRFFAEARRIGALELLLATPLTVDQILRGQWMALRRLFLVPSIALLGAGILPLFLIFLTDLPNAFPTWIILGSAYAFSIPKLICDLLAAAWTGMLVGLTAKKPNLAPGLTVLYTVVLPVAAFCVPDVFISLPLFLWARDKLYRELRILSSVSYRPVAPLYAPAPPAAKPPLGLHS